MGEEATASSLDEALPASAAFADAGAWAQALEQGRWLFAQPCTFVMGCVGMDRLPQHPLVEVAFAGRSNVGKSSLVNALTGRKTLARASNTPGRTQELNFFRLGPQADETAGLMMVDLPGYGFARAPRDQVARWNRLVMAYLQGRSPLRRVCLLIDSRHGLKANDREVMTMLDTAAVNYQVILTKADKLGPTQARATHAAVAAEVSRRVAAHPDVLLTSADKGLGVPELRAQLAALAGLRVA
ncbi:ribosome biogenesis GTP-binding protein YihA/YsxC [Pararhodospirillum oryzae]|uniref:Probable GTP-binding protein EngB n=1 Tax=Pararhodospirillum oryzae TaxID=478448 RepID=A0A512H496_9PROT|nr:ribosome biogenesis GTP-binding protein YihA/YsxC [Pararhodospirillum oryzae]GEO80238.1 putative GTP-binding protein EngB [Pararhodospirillum oryzae]